MGRYKATIRVWATVEFDDDEISDLTDQASDQFLLEGVDTTECDYSVMEVVEIKDRPNG